MLKKDKKEDKQAKKFNKKFEELEAKCQENLAGWQRAQADYQNLKRETEQQNLEFRRYANANLLMELLPVMEHFNMAFNALSEDDKQTPWCKGIEHIKNELEQFMQNQGVEKINVVGEKFDPQLHEAVEEQTDEEKEDGAILKEVKAGYKYHDKVLVCPKVIVNKLEHEDKEDKEIDD